MAAFVGTDTQVRLQERLRERQSWIAETPGVANGGRILHFVEPAQLGWETVRALAEEDGLAGFPSVVADEAVTAIHSHLGPQWKTPTWNVFLGSPEQVLSTCSDLIDAIALPSGWRIDLLERPSDEQIGAIQSLNAETGVSPYPAYYMRGEAVPVLTACISDAEGALVATASAADRYHPRCRLAAVVFAGMVSVSPAQRGRGLGRLVNAIMLVESYARFAWSLAKEQVAADNAASQAMIEACGLGNGEGLVSIAASCMEETLTR